MIKLPQIKKKPKDNPESMSWLFFGSSKVGKTSLCAQFPDHFILECNPGNADHLERNSVDIYSWEEAIEYINLVAKNPKYCKTFIVDEVHRLHHQLYKWARKLLKKKDGDQNNYDVWLLTRDKFIQIIDAIKELPMGCIITGNVEEINEGSMPKLDVAGSKQIRAGLDGRFQIRAFIEKDQSGERFMVLDGDPRIEVGHCLNGHFNYGGNRLTRFSLGFSPEQGYANFTKAFNNQMPGNVIVKPKPRVLVKKKS